MQISVFNSDNFLVELTDIAKPVFTIADYRCV